jgi:hypothetical protein
MEGFKNMTWDNLENEDFMDKTLNISRNHSSKIIIKKDHFSINRVTKVLSRVIFIIKND